MKYLKPILPAVLFFVLSIGFTGLMLAGSGCAAIAPGADPLVVNAERVETVATSAFDTVLILDNSNRSFWMTNAPAFHGFCEWIRTPITIESTNVMPRGLAMIKLVDDDKLIYQANASSSNILTSALADLQAALNQAQSWTIIVQSPTH